MTDSFERNAAYKLGGLVCKTPEELADAICAEWDSAREHLKRGYIGRWIEHSLGELDLKIKLDSLIEAYSDTNVALFHFLLELNPNRDGCYRGVTLTRERLAEFLQADSPDKHRIICEIHHHDLLALLRNKEAGLLTNLSKAWHEEILSYFRARADALRYKQVWEDHPDLLEDLLDKNDMDHLLMLATRDSDEFELGVRYYAHVVKAALLLIIVESQLQFENAIRLSEVELENKDFFESAERGNLTPASSGSEVSLKERDENQTVALERAWVKSYFGGSKRNLGQSFVDIDVGKRAAVFVRQKSGAKNAFEERLSKFDSQLFSQTRIIQHVSFGVASFFLAAFGLLTHIDVVSGLVLFAAFAMPFFVFWSPWRTHGLRDAKEAFLFAAAFGGTVSLMLSLGLVTSYTSLGSAYFYSLCIGLVTSGASIASVWRAGELRKEKLMQLDQVIKGSAAKFDRDQAAREIDRVVNTRVSSSPSNTSHGGGLQLSHKRREEGNAGAASRAAPTHGDGLSFQMGNQALSTDGKITTDLTDGLSIDTEGTVNQRVFDNVTLHSDGTHTTKIWDGLEIRSDGQISTDLFGYRVSSGGKEKKKTSSFLDW